MVQFDWPFSGSLRMPPMTQLIPPEKLVVTVTTNCAIKNVYKYNVESYYHTFVTVK